MAKITIVKHSDYTVITNAILRDNRLSMKDIGLLIWMLSKPATWDYTINGIVAARGGEKSQDKKSAIRAALKQLEVAGYLRRERVRQVDGRLGATEYTLYEVPQPPENSDVAPKSDFPTLEKPTLENRTQLSKDTTNYRNNNNNTVVVFLESLGINAKKAEVLAKKYDETQITAAIAAAKVYMAKHQTQSVPGLIVKAIAEGWTAPTPSKNQGYDYNMDMMPSAEVLAYAEEWAE